MEDGYKVWGKDGEYKDAETYLENMEDGYKVWGKDGEYRDEKPTTVAPARIPEYILGEMNWTVFT